MSTIKIELSTREFMALACLVGQKIRKADSTSIGFAELRGKLPKYAKAEGLTRSQRLHAKNLLEKGYARPRN